MANTNNVLATFAIVFLVSLSLNSAFAKHNLDILNVSEKRLDHQLQPLVREKRQNEVKVFHLRNNSNSLLELEKELSEPKPIYERRTEEIKEMDQIGQNDKRKKQKEPSVESETSNDSEEDERDVEDDVFSYKSMHDLIQALILADEEDITKRLQQLREAKNATKSETSSNLPKREAVASSAAAASATATAAASSNLLGANLWDEVPLDDLDAHSCEVEAFSHGHLHVSGTIVHEFCCELRKSWHYALITSRNLKSELTLGPLIVGADVVGDGIFDHLFHHTSHLFHTAIREPHHLLILPDIIRDAVPFSSVIGAIHRIKCVFFKVLHFGLDLVRGHIHHVLAHFFSHSHLGILHHLRRFGSMILPLEEIAESIVPTAMSAAATATATATTMTTTASSDVVPDYHRSLAEVLSSFRGFYDGYHASGIPHLIRTGAKSFSWSSAFSGISSYLPRIPFSNCFGYGPVEQGSTMVTASSSSSASSSVDIAGPIVSPLVDSIASPMVEPTIVPVAPVVETVSSSASATATVETVSSAGPTMISSGVPCESTSSSTAAAVATATATAATAASPIVSDYQTAPLIQPVPTLSPVIVSDMLSEGINPMAITTPEVAAPSAAVLEDTAVAIASATASSIPASVVDRVPPTLPLFAHRPRPILSTVAGSRIPLEPTRYHGLDLDIDRRMRYPLIRSRVFPSVQTSTSSTSSAVASAAASSSAVSDGSLTSATASSSATSSIFSDGFNMILPREQIVGALGYDYLLPGDIIAVTLRNKSILCGRVLDATSPIRFGFLRPKLRASLLRHGGRVWNLLPRDFRDPECIRKFNNPLLMRYGL